jgi:hypothetical protein
MSRAWEGGCEEGVMMLKANEEVRRMKVGSHNIMNQLAFQGVVKSTFVGEWRKDLQIVAVVVT